MKKDLLFADQRIHPKIYDVKIQGIGNGRFPSRAAYHGRRLDCQGYFILVAQLVR